VSISSQAVVDLLDEFFGDTSRARVETKRGLEEIQSKVEGYLDSMDDVDTDDPPDDEDELDFEDEDDDSEEDEDEEATETD
jgi:hypothetical protein